MYNSELSKEGKEINYHLSPYDSEVMTSGMVSPGWDPDLSEKRRDRYVIYLLLMLLPAINLGCMTRSRFRHRISEIGVRRAFGAKRKSIVAQILFENMIITLLGGIIGLALSVLFMLSASSLFFRHVANVDIGSLELLYATPSLSMLFTWNNFAFAFVGCLVLNVMSAMLPAWKASRVSPVVAISKVRF